MPELTQSTIHEGVLRGLRPPIRRYWWVVLGLAAAIGWALTCWVYQVRTGMGVAGISHPVGWGFYIANFVFWVGIAHSGTLISAILRLVRARWRDAVSRSAEAMTVIAIMTAGLFPLIHLGRVWVVYYIIPYPTQRLAFPNFQSALVWDVLAVLTYLTVSSIFFYVGMIPDLAIARDRYERELGHDHPRTRAYRRLALGWSGAASQYHHYGRAYLYFAALATPLVVSVHSIVSWDFATSLLPGWHSTIFAPYFVAGAIHSGLAMVLLLLIPMRKLLGLERLITPDHFELVAKTMLLTTAIMAYSYIVEPWDAWKSGQLVEKQFLSWRATGWAAPLFWALFPMNVLAPAAFVFRRVRRSRPALLLIGALVVLGMWFERVMIIPTSTSHDFLPHNWGAYSPTWVEVSITLGSVAWFTFWFLGFSKHLPVISAAELKTQVVEEDLATVEPCKPARGRKPRPLQRHGLRPALLMVFSDASAMLRTLRQVCDAGFDRREVFSPGKLDAVQEVLHRTESPVRHWTFAGAITGIAGGFWLAGGTAALNDLIVGAKPPIAIIPYCIPGFEGGILLGSLANLVALIVYARLGHTTPPDGYDPSFGLDHFGLLVHADAPRWDELRAIADASHAEEVRVLT